MAVSIHELTLQLGRLHQATGDQRREADAWLQALVASPQSWDLFGQVLRTRGVPHDLLTFAALGLKQKLQNSIEELGGPEGQRNVLRSLLDTARLYVMGPPPVRTQLCLAIAVLVVAGVPKAIEFAFSYLSDCVPLLCELLSVVGEEASVVLAQLEPESCPFASLHSPPRSQLATPTLSPTRSPQAGPAPVTLSPPSLARGAASVLSGYHTAVTAAREAAPTVLSFLHSNACTMTVPLTERVRCVGRWVRFVTTSDIADRIAQSPLFTQAFAVLKTGVPDEEAADFVCEIAHLSARVDSAAGLRSVVLSHVPGIAEGYQRAANATAAAAVARVLSAVGAAYAEVIANSLTPDAMSLVSMVLRCAKHVSSEVVIETLGFWSRLCLWVLAQAPEVRTLTMAVLSQPLQELVCHLIATAHYPTDADTWEDDEEEEWHRFRTDQLAPTLRDLCAVLGAGATLGPVRARAVEAAKDSASWFELEAAFFALTACNVALTEADAVLGSFFALASEVASTHRRVGNAVLSAAAKFAWWFDSDVAAPILQPLLSACTLGLEQGRQQDREHAVKCFQALCAACSQRIADAALEAVCSFAAQAAFTPDTELSIREREVVAGSAALVVSHAGPQVGVAASLLFDAAGGHLLKAAQASCRRSAERVLRPVCAMLVAVQQAAADLLVLPQSPALEDPSLAASNVCSQWTAAGVAALWPPIRPLVVCAAAEEDATSDAACEAASLLAVLAGGSSSLATDVRLAFAESLPPGVSPAVCKGVARLSKYAIVNQQSSSADAPALVELATSLAVRAAPVLVLPTTGFNYALAAGILGIARQLLYSAPALLLALPAQLVEIALECAVFQGSGQIPMTLQAWDAVFGFAEAVTELRHGVQRRDLYIANMAGTLLSQPGRGEKLTLMLLRAAIQERDEQVSTTAARILTRLPELSLAGYTSWVTAGLDLWAGRVPAALRLCCCEELCRIGDSPRVASSLRAEEALTELRKAVLAA
eukprot:Hpha_TRINITY_DN16082_c4_g8::TRINITY_DN16082_c4_g8_i1::g.120184::m.120184/K15436/TRPO3, MTR10; transportin-3